MIGVHPGRNAVPEIENMATAVPIARQYRPHFRTDTLGRCEQHARVHIALQRHALTHPGAGAADIGGPVESHRVRTTFGNRLQPLAAALGEHNHRHFAPVRFGGQL